MPRRTGHVGMRRVRAWYMHKAYFRNDGRRGRHVTARRVLYERDVLVHHPDLVPHVACLAVRRRAQRYLAVVIVGAPRV
eukprot:scaffold39787_cov65-Phaeocystis_antarctica.AAC.1